MKAFSFFLFLMISSGLATAASQTKPNPDKPTRLYVLSDTQNYDSYTDTKEVAVSYADGTFDFSQEEQTWDHYNHTWNDTNGGSGYSMDKGQDNDVGPGTTPYAGTNITSTSIIWSNAPVWLGGNTVPGVGVTTNYDGSVTTGDPPALLIAGEHCVVSDPHNPPASVYSPAGELGSRVANDTVTNTYRDTYTRTADTVVHLQTGGRALPGRQNLWCLSGSVREILAVRAQPTLNHPQMDTSSGQGITNTAVQINGHALYSDGNYWTTLPDGEDLDMTPRVLNMDFYTFNVNTQEYKPTITANGFDLSTNTPTVCVGQQVNLQANWNPSLPSGTQSSYEWNMDPDYINSWLPPVSTSGSSLPYIDQTLMTNSATTVWWYGWNLQQPKSIYCDVTNQFVNGQTIALTEEGHILIYKPQVTFPYPTIFVTQAIPMLSWTGLTCFLELGNATGYGWMEFGAKIKTLTNFPGTANWTQLINRNVTLPFQSTSSEFWLDNGQFYNNGKGQPLPTDVPSGGAAGIPFGDNPGVGSIFNYDGVITITDKFETYLVFKPIDDSAGPSIWVTLGIVTWGWSASEDWWMFIGGSVTPPTYTDSDDFPNWPFTIYNTSGL